MRTNYHTHTYRCGHAVGNDEDYVIKAIEDKYDILGFSDHVFIPNLDKDPHIRGDYSELGDYLASLENLKTKYKDKIQILKGFECEYFPELEAYYRDLLKSKTLDYLILGQHYTQFDYKHLYGDIDGSKEAMDRYAALIEQGLATGLFSILVHPDIYLSHYPVFDDFVYGIAYRICISAKKHKVPLEINQGGIRRRKRLIADEIRYPYPVRQFFEVAKHVGNEIIVGVDAHNPNDFSHPVNQGICDELIKEWGLNVVDRAILKKVE